MLKVLFLPVNIASQPFITAEAINKTGKAKAICITNSSSQLNSRGRNTLYIPKNYSRRKPIKWLYYKLTYRSQIKKWIKWADVLHYTWAPAFSDASDLDYANKLNKPIFVEWLGSDIRKPEILFRINPYYKNSFKEDYEYFELESSDHSERVQKEFNKANATAFVNPEMYLFINPIYFSKTVKGLMVRLNINDFSPNYPEANKKRILIIHSPTARICKGTNYIIQAINTLKEKYDFHFKLIENLPRDQALQLIRECDIYIDQLIIGSYGLATIEAMSMGKPVICYIMKEVFEAGLPADCPIINANPETITIELERLITNPSLRSERGIEGRKYVENYHNSENICLDLINIYEIAQKEVKRSKKA